MWNGGIYTTGIGVNVVGGWWRLNGCEMGVFIQ